MRGGHRGRGGRGGDGRSVHERLGPVPSWSAPEDSPAPVSREGQGSFDRSRLGGPTRHPREDRDQERPRERRARSGSRSTSGRPIVRGRSRSVEELGSGSSFDRGRGRPPRSRSPRLVVRRQSRSPAGQAGQSRRSPPPRRSHDRRHHSPTRRKSSLPRRSRSSDFYRGQASPPRYQGFGSPRFGSPPPRSPARHRSPNHRRSPVRPRASPLRHRSPFPPRRFSPRRLTPPPHHPQHRSISPRRPFHREPSPPRRLSPRRRSPDQIPRRHSPRRHSPRRHSPRRHSPRANHPKEYSPERTFQGRYSPGQHLLQSISAGRTSPNRQFAKGRSPRRISPRRPSPRMGSPHRQPPRSSSHSYSAARRSRSPRPHQGPQSHRPLSPKNSHPGEQSFMIPSNSRGDPDSSGIGRGGGGRRGSPPAGARPRPHDQGRSGKRPEREEEQHRPGSRQGQQRVASPREVTVSDRSISVTKRFNQSETRPEKKFKQGSTDDNGGRPSTSHPSTSKRTGKPARRSPGKAGNSDQKGVARQGPEDQRGSRPTSANTRGRPGQDDHRGPMRPGAMDNNHMSNDRAGDVWRQELPPPPPRISQPATSEGPWVSGPSQSLGQEVAQVAALAGTTLGARPGKTLLHHFCEQAALSGQSLAKGEQLLLTWQRAGHTEESLRRLLHQEQPETQSALQLLLVKALSCLSGIELSALNVNVSELLDQTVAYFMGSGSSRFNSQVPLFTAPSLEPNPVLPAFFPSVQPGGFPLKSQPAGFSAPLKPQESHGFTLAPIGDGCFPSGSGLKQFGQNNQNEAGLQLPPPTSAHGAGGMIGYGMQRPVEDSGPGRQQEPGMGQGFNFPQARANQGQDQPIFGQRLQDVQGFSKPPDNQGFSRSREGQGFFRHDEDQSGQGSTFPRGEGGFPSRSRNEASSSQHGFRARK